MQNSEILLLITGGTIDKDYQTTSGELIFSKTFLPELLNEANQNISICTMNLMLKDSLEMTLDDRELILQCCNTETHKLIVITHGTDTMSLTAQHLLNSGQLADKTIVLTGAMRPFKLGCSDASFNIGSALMAVQLAANGVYIAMNGQLFNAAHVTKNRSIGQFETT